MNQAFEIYEKDDMGPSKFLTTRTFTSEPQNGDRVDLGDDGIVVITRRWTSNGQLVLDARRQSMRQVSWLADRRSGHISGVTQTQVKE